MNSKLCKQLRRAAKQHAEVGDALVYRALPEVEYLGQTPMASQVINKPLSARSNYRRLKAYARNA